MLYSFNSNHPPSSQQPDALSFPFFSHSWFAVSTPWILISCCLWIKSHCLSRPLTVCLYFPLSFSLQGSSAFVLPVSQYIFPGGESNLCIVSARSSGALWITKVNKKIPLIEHFLPYNNVIFIPQRHSEWFKWITLLCPVMGGSDMQSWPGSWSTTACLSCVLSLWLSASSRSPRCPLPTFTLNPR